MSAFSLEVPPTPVQFGGPPEGKQKQKDKPLKRMKKKTPKNPYISIDRKE